MTENEHPVVALLLEGLDRDPDSPWTELGQPIFTGSLHTALPLNTIVDKFLVGQFDLMNWPTVVQEGQFRLTREAGAVVGIYFKRPDNVIGYVLVTYRGDIMSLSIRYDDVASRLVALGALEFPDPAVVERVPCEELEELAMA